MHIDNQFEYLVSKNTPVMILGVLNALGIILVDTSYHLQVFTLYFYWFYFILSVA